LWKGCPVAIRAVSTASAPGLHHKSAPAQIPSSSGPHLVMAESFHGMALSQEWNKTSGGDQT